MKTPALKREYKNRIGSLAAVSRERVEAVGLTAAVRRRGIQHVASEPRLAAGHIGEVVAQAGFGVEHQGGRAGVGPGDPVVALQELVAVAREGEQRPVLKADAGTLTHAQGTARDRGGHGGGHGGRRSGHGHGGRWLGDRGATSVRCNTDGAQVVASQIINKNN